MKIKLHITKSGEIREYSNIKNARAFVRKHEKILTGRIVIFTDDGNVFEEITL